MAIQVEIAVLQHVAVGATWQAMPFELTLLEPDSSVRF